LNPLILTIIEFIKLQNRQMAEKKAKYVVGQMVSFDHNLSLQKGRILRVNPPKDQYSEPTYDIESASGGTYLGKWQSQLDPLPEQTASQPLINLDASPSQQREPKTPPRSNQNSNIDTHSNQKVRHAVSKNQPVPQTGDFDSWDSSNDAKVIRRLQEENQRLREENQRLRLMDRPKTTEGTFEGLRQDINKQGCALQQLQQSQKDMVAENEKLRCQVEQNNARISELECKVNSTNVQQRSRELEQKIRQQQRSRELEQKIRQQQGDKPEQKFRQLGGKPSGRTPSQGQPQQQHMNQSRSIIDSRASMNHESVPQNDFDDNTSQGQFNQTFALRAEPQQQQHVNKSGSTTDGRASMNHETVPQNNIWRQYNSNNQNNNNRGSQNDFDNNTRERERTVEEMEVEQLKREIEIEAMKYQKDINQCQSRSK
jgi:hypothetical protein